MMRITSYTWSSNHTACHIPWIMTVVLSELGLTFSRSRQAKGSTSLSLPDWTSRQGEFSYLKSLAVLPIPKRIYCTVLAHSLPWQMQGSFLEYSSSLYFDPFLPLDLRSLRLGARKESKTVSFLSMGKCILFSRMDGLSSMSPLASLGFLTEILKATAPPKLMPHMKIFRLGYLVFNLMVNCSLTLTNSSNDYTLPRSYPPDCPKFLKSQPATTTPSEASSFASSPHMLVWPFREWKKTRTARGFTFCGGYQKWVMSLTPWQSQYSLVGKKGISFISCRLDLGKLTIRQSQSSLMPKGMLLKYSQSRWNFYLCFLCCLAKQKQGFGEDFAIGPQRLKIWASIIIKINHSRKTSLLLSLPFSSHFHGCV